MHQVAGKIRMRSAESASAEIILYEIGGDEAGLRNVQVLRGTAMVNGTAYRRDIKQPVLFD